MSRSYRLCMIVLSLLPVFANRAEAALEERDAQAIYIASGMEEQLKSIAQRFAGTVRESFAKDPAGQRVDAAAAERLALESFDPAVTGPILTATLRQGLSPTEAAQILAWFDSALGKKIAAVENAASTPAADAEIVSFAQTLEQVLPPESRLLAIQALDQALGVTERAMQTALSFGMAAGLDALTAGAAPDAQAIAHLRDEAEKQRAIIREGVEAQTFAYQLFAYRTLQDEELRQYIAFAKSVGGIAWQKALFRGLDEALAGGTLRLGRSLSTLKTPSSTS